MENKREQIGKFWNKKFSKYISLKNASLLEVGCGEGRLGPILKEFVVKEYLGIDPKKKAISFAKENFSSININYEVGKAEKIHSKNKFDILFYTFSWHFIKDFDEAIKEAKRVLKKRGILVILEPNKNTENWASEILRKDSPNFSQRTYDKKMKALEKARRKLSNQKEFQIVSEEKGNAMKPSMWILKHKS